MRSITKVVTANLSSLMKPVKGVRPPSKQPQKAAVKAGSPKPSPKGKRK